MFSPMFQFFAFEKAIFYFGNKKITEVWSELMLVSFLQQYETAPVRTAFTIIHFFQYINYLGQNHLC